MPVFLDFPEPQYHIEGWFRCTKCKQYLPLDEFAKANTKKKGYQSRCRLCMKFDRILRNYNLSEEKYRSMIDEQRQMCAICCEITSDLCIDHDHSCCPESSKSCGKCVRQLLCHNCNRVLGSVKDSKFTLSKMINYLERHENAYDH